MANSSIFIIIETPKGSTEKYDYDQKSGHFLLKKALPLGMHFPLDFGFIPNTRGEDGDPLDIVLYSEFSTFPGCRVECRLLGAIKAEQAVKNGHPIRNDRYIAIPLVSPDAETIHSIDQLPEKTLKELEAFFVNYNKEEGKNFRPLGYLNAKQSMQQIKKQKK